MTPATALRERMRPMLAELDRVADCVAFGLPLDVGALQTLVGFFREFVDGVYQSWLEAEVLTPLEQAGRAAPAAAIRAVREDGRGYLAALVCATAGDLRGEARTRDRWARAARAYVEVLREQQDLCTLLPSEFGDSPRSRDSDLRYLT